MTVNLLTRHVFENLTEATPGEIVKCRVLEASSVNADVQKATVVLIKAGPGNPVHKHFYSNSLLEGAVAKGMFEEKKCYANHPSKKEEQERPEGDIRQLLGFFKDARIQYETAPKGLLGFTSGEQRAMVVADFYPEVGQMFVMEKLRTAKLFDQLYPSSEDGYIGWSIKAGGSSTPKNLPGAIGWKDVTEFTLIGSIDMVTQAGAGGRLLTFKEVAMKGLFARPSSRKGPSVAEARSQLSAHIVDSLKEAGVEPTSAQLKTFDKGLELLPRDLLTENFVFTTLGESGIQFDEDTIPKLEEALNKDDKFSELITKFAEAKGDSDKSGHAYNAAGDNADDEEEEAGGGKGKGKNSANPNDDDQDDGADEMESKEARVIISRIRDSSTRLFAESMLRTNENLQKTNKSLQEALKSERALREDAQGRLGAAKDELRTQNAKKLLIKANLTDKQKEALFPKLCEIALTEQPAEVKMWENLLEGSGNGRFGGPGPGQTRLGESKSRTVSFSAMRD